jgi:hypothetical protein
MRDRIHPRRLTRSRRTSLLIGLVVSGILLAGCGGGSAGPTTATADGAPAAGSRSATGATVTKSRSTAPGVAVSALAFAKCMRANGAPDFPDPAPGGGFIFPVRAGFDPSSPSAKAAQSKCQRFMPSRSSGPTFSARSLAEVVKIAECMRQHGVPQFPDPTTTRPSFAAGIREITDYDGAYLAFPAALDMQSPVYKRAAAACGTLAEKLGTGPH